MYCEKCGAQIPDDSVFCEFCGASIEPLDIEYEPETVETEAFKEDKAPEIVDVPEDEIREVEEAEEIEEVEEVDYVDDVEEVDSIEDFDFEETGRPDEAEGDWFKSFEDLAPKATDRPEPEPEVVAEPEPEIEAEPEVEPEPEIEAETEEEPESEEGIEFAEEESVEEDFEEEPEIEEEIEEEPEDEDEPETEAEDEEDFEEEIEDETDAEDEPEIEEEIEEEPKVDDESDIEEEIDEAEMVSEEEIAYEDEADIETEIDEPEVEEDFEEEIEEEIDEAESELEVAAEEETDGEPVAEAEPGAEEQDEKEGPDVSAKVGAWLGSLGKTVRTGTGWAVDAAKEKASKIKEEKKTKAAEEDPENKREKKKEEKKKISERDIWTEEDEGDIDLGQDFWYRSNHPDRPVREYNRAPERKPVIADIDGDEAAVEDNKTEREGSAISASDHNDPNHGDNSENNTWETRIMEREKTEEETPAKEEEAKPPKNKMKIVLIAAIIAVLLGAGGVIGSKMHKDSQLEAKYQASMDKAAGYTEAKEYPKAEEVYKGLLKQYPDRAELYEELAQVYILEEKYEDATNTVNEGIARTGKSEAFAALTEDIKALTSTEWREPFRRILAGNEWAVRSYDDKNGVSVALCDITGDKKPEMFFFTQEYFGYGKLHICIYDPEKEKAKEFTYTCKNRSTQYQDAFYDIEQDTSGYVIYKSKKTGRFGIYESFLHGGIDAWQTTNEFTLDMNGIKRVSTIEACITTRYRVSEDEDEDDDNTEYYKNDKKIKYDSYMKDFNRILGDIGEVMITSESSAGDKEIWSRIVDMDEGAMTYDGVMKILDEDAI